MSARTSPSSSPPSAFRLYTQATFLAQAALELKQLAGELLLHAAASPELHAGQACSSPPAAAAAAAVLAPIAIPPPKPARELGLAVATTDDSRLPAKRSQGAAARPAPAKRSQPAKRTLDLEPANAELRAAPRWHV